MVMPSGIEDQYRMPGSTRPPPAPPTPSTDTPQSTASKTPLQQAITREARAGGDLCALPQRGRKRAALAPLARLPRRGLPHPSGRPLGRGHCALVQRAGADRLRPRRTRRTGTARARLPGRAPTPPSRRSAAAGRGPWLQAEFQPTAIRREWPLAALDAQGILVSGTADLVVETTQGCF